MKVAILMGSDSDFARLDLGRELDLGITWEALPSLTARLQHARYDAGGGRADPDVRKTWLTLHYAY